MDNIHRQIELIMVKIAMIASHRKRITVYSVLQKAFVATREILIARLLLNNRLMLASIVLKILIMTFKLHY